MLGAYNWKLIHCGKEKRTSENTQKFKYLKDECSTIVNLEEITDGDK